MWWAGKRASARTAIAYAGERAVRLSLGGVLLVAADVEGRDAALAALSAGIRDLPRGVRLRVAVSGTVCRPFLLPDVSGVVGEADWTVIAASMVEDRAGMPADSVVWLDDGQTSPRLAVAMDAVWQRALAALGGRQLDSLRPWWALAIEAARASTPGDSSDVLPDVPSVLRGLAVADSDELVLLIADGAIYRVAQTYALGDEPAAVVLNRALVTHELSMDEIELIEFDGAALPGQPSGEALSFRKEGVA